MANANRSGLWFRCLWGLLLGGLGSGELLGAETDAALEAAVKPVTAVPAEVDQQQRSYLRLQEQLHATQLAIEQARQEFSVGTKASSEALAARLESLEHSAVEQRDQQMQTLRESNRNQVVLAASIVGVGLLALAFTALFQSRGMNRLADIATQLSDERSSVGGRFPALSGQGERLLLDTDGDLRVNKTLLLTIERLEHRIRELEHTVQPELPLGDASLFHAEAKLSLQGAGRAEPRPVDHVSVLLGKGQALLSLGQAENALSCYDQALAAAPHYAEAHVRKGLALERLKRMDEAILSYDRAIALNPALTQAYLCKGAAFNHLERYGDALACYERALRSEAQG